jgi:hypothetical protein
VATTRTSQAYETLAKADQLWAHYGLGYDFPALEKVAKLVIPKHKQRDSVVYLQAEVSRTCVRLTGASCSAGGYRRSFTARTSCGVGLQARHPKADYEGPWGEWSEQMHSYMDQDVETLLAFGTT